MPCAVGKGTRHPRPRAAEVVAKTSLSLDFCSESQLNDHRLRNLLAAIQISSDVYGRGRGRYLSFVRVPGHDGLHALVLSTQLEL